MTTQARKPRQQAASEHDEQVALFRWAAMLRDRHPALGLLFAIPNGGDRHPATAARLKAEGVRRGVSDVFLPVPSQGYHGLWIEMKAGRNKPTTEQVAWLEQMRALGHATAVCYSWIEAAERVAGYLGLKVEDVGLEGLL